MAERVADPAFAIHWFRRDLRVPGNRALERARERFNGRVLGLFCVDPAILGRDDLSPARFLFLLKTLEALREELREAGGDLLVLEGGPQAAFDWVSGHLKDRERWKQVSWSRDYEPFARTRDDAMARHLEEKLGLATATARDHLLLEPMELRKEDGTPFRVYTPYKRRWLERLKTDEVRGRIREDVQALERAAGPRSKRARLFDITWTDALRVSPERADRLGQWTRTMEAKCPVALPPAGHRAAMERLKRFAASALPGYAKSRDYPAETEGTSGLSIYFKNGSLTVPQVVAALGLKPDSKFLAELAWREFLYSILYHFPRVERGAYNEKFADLAWENDPRLLDAWKEGRTGFPIVDAGMRELAMTGRMHNRVRMIVASFLTKDLLVDWREGERHFMRNLLDGDLAANNGGWQWAASTGCDPQPWFRIFNPVSQSLRFDPRGEYIRRHCPELRGLSDRAIHYPRDPIVNHDERRLKALAMYKAQARKKA